MTLLPTQQSHGVRVRCWEVRYHSHDWRGKPVMIFGFYGVPLDGVTRHPALLMLHGGKKDDGGSSANSGKPIDLVFSIPELV